MKKFKFNLESVHNVRELRQEKEQAELARLRQAALETEQRLEQLSEKRAKAVIEYTNSMKAGRSIDPNEMDLHSKHIASLDKHIRMNEIELEEKKLACRGQVEVLVSAAREVKVTSKLREKQKAVHDLETAKHEQSALDEITNAKYARQTGKH